MCTGVHIAMTVCCACSGNKVSQRRDTAINQSSDRGRGTAAGNKTSTCIVLHRRQCVLLFIVLLECVVPVQTKNSTEGRTQPSSSQQTGVQGQPQVLLSCMGISVHISVAASGMTRSWDLVFYNQTVSNFAAHSLQF